jgi:predicted N-formylglutamate amidohydrolase
MDALLTAEDPPPFRVERASGASPFVLVCDHAGRALPSKLGDLGVPAAELTRHIAWDIGIAEVGRRLAPRLDAFLITQTYSRLVIDANRHPGSPQSIVERSEHTDVPGNVGVTREAADQRAREIFHPYHLRIAAELDARAQRGQPSILVTLHSFTPVFMSRARAWHAGILYNRDARFARVMLELLRGEAGLHVGDNEPYAASDATDYALVVHGERRGLLNVEVEIRQDLIEHTDGQAQWAERLHRLLARAREIADATRLVEQPAGR